MSMSRLSTELRIIIEELEISQGELARMAGLPQGQISRYLSGNTDPTPETLKKIFLAFAEKERARLAVAHLNDQLPEYAAKLVRIESCIAQDADKPSRALRKLPRALREAFDRLEAAAAEENDIAEAILAFDKALTR